jgi:hypothetical protein
MDPPFLQPRFHCGPKPERSSADHLIRRLVPLLPANTELIIFEPNIEHFSQIA